VFERREIMSRISKKIKCALSWTSGEGSDLMIIDSRAVQRDAPGIPSSCKDWEKSKKEYYRLSVYTNKHISLEE
jgi:hypothetical protein